ncbi:MAG: DUF2149 domain-containing protein [Pseudomonadota bacterium]
MTRRRFGILDGMDGEDDDPVLSAINLVDVFLVVIGMLMIAVIQNPVNPFAHDTLTIIRNAGRPDMEILQKDGQTVTRFRSSGASGAGDGEKAGTAYRLKDGTMVYVPAGAEPVRP